MTSELRTSGGFIVHVKVSNRQMGYMKVGHWRGMIDSDGLHFCDEEIIEVDTLPSP